MVELPHALLTAAAAFKLQFMKKSFDRYWHGDSSFAGEVISSAFQIGLSQEGVDGASKGTQKHDSRFTGKAIAVLVNHVFKVGARLTWSSGMCSLKAERMLSC